MIGRANVAAVDPQRKKRMKRLEIEQQIAVAAAAEGGNIRRN